MTKITHIKKIKIEKLWGYDDLNFEWTLNSTVNVLAGDNGSGKSTIINLITGLLTGADRFTIDKLFIDSINIEFNDSSTISLKKFSGSREELEEKAKHDISSEEMLSVVKEKHKKNTYNDIKEIHMYLPFLNGKRVETGSDELKNIVNMDGISTFDQPLLPLEILQKVHGEEIETYLDLLISRLEKKYLNYQINIGKRAIEALRNNNDRIEEIDVKKNKFCDIMDSLFITSEKKINREENYISFLRRNEREIKPYQLSSGEKQILIILLTVLIQDNQPSIIVMDEPEISLHTDWQENLIDNIRELNKNTQIIIATHSPFVISKGWADEQYVFQMDKIKLR